MDGAKPNDPQELGSLETTSTAPKPHFQGYLALKEALKGS